MAEPKPQTRLGRIVEAVLIGLATMAIVTFSIWAWQSITHGDLVIWLGGVSCKQFQQSNENKISDVKFWTACTEYAGNEACDRIDNRAARKPPDCPEGFLHLEFCILPSTRSRLSQDSLNL